MTKKIHAVPGISLVNNAVQGDMAMDKLKSYWPFGKKAFEGAESEKQLTKICEVCRFTAIKTGRMKVRSNFYRNNSYI